MSVYFKYYFIILGDDDLYAVLYWTYDIADSSKFRQKLNVSSPDPSKTDIIGIVDDWLRTGNVSWKGLSQALIHLGKREEALGIAACHPGTLATCVLLKCILINSV